MLRLLSLCCAASLWAVCLWGGDWRPVRGSILGGLSGLALVENTGAQSTFLIVHDNKAMADSRLALITVAGPQPVAYRPVTWKFDADCIDLEAVTAMPGRPGEFLALISRGLVYHLRLDAARQTAETLGRFTLPDLPANPNLEALSLQSLQGRSLLVWADRGDGDRPARLFFGELKLGGGYQVSDVASAGIRVPWPVQNVRHVSDLRVDEGGVLYFSAASDAGDDGPFTSAIYLGGVFRVGKKKTRFAAYSQLIRLRTLADRKIEGMEIVPGSGGLIFATDDENFGGWVLSTW
jgi:hypothetical protein